MTSLLTESSLLPPNPLDLAEQLIMDRNWAFDRPMDDELVAEVAGAWCNWRIWLAWQEDMGTLTFSCAMDTKLPEAQRAKLYPLLALVNERLLLGHFDISSEDGTIAFRHALPLRGGFGASAEQLEDLLDIAIGEGERFYPAFQSVVWGGMTAQDALGAAMFDVAGEA